MKKVGIFVGSKIAPNVEKLLFNVGKMLGSEFYLDLIGSADLTEELNDLYQHKRYGGKKGAEGFKRIKQAFHNCRKYCSKEDPDILFQITKYPIYSLPVSTIGSLSSVPTIVRLSGDHFRAYKTRRNDMDELTRTLFMHNLLGGLPLKLADRVIVISEKIKTEAERKGCPSNKIDLIPQPIDTERFSPASKEEKDSLRNELDLPLNKRIALYVGRLNDEKGLPILEKAIARLKEKNILFCLVGSGECGPRLENKYPSLVRFEGFVEQNHIHTYYKAADLLVHPSPLEGVPNTLLEAMAVEIPVIAREADYSRELNVPTFKDPDELIDMLEGKWKTTPLPERFRWDTLKEKYIEVINKTIREC
ncbi:MAG: glycosyltransferase family 4 protein [Thermoplasmata archaeon]